MRSVRIALDRVGARDRARACAGPIELNSTASSRILTPTPHCVTPRVVMLARITAPSRAWTPTSLFSRLVSSRCASSSREGAAYTQKRTFTERDVETFASVTGDMNPIHDARANASAWTGGKLREPAVHGMLVASAFGAALARWKPGAVYASQELKFRAPTRVGEEMEIEIALIRQSGTRARYETTARRVKCGTVCVDGVALAILPEE